MNRFWGSVIKPILFSLKLNKIIEIGAYKGETTIRLLEYCKNVGGNLTIIDPFPLFKEEEYNRIYKGRYQLYKKTSLEVLPMLKDYQVVLIDGDHNWYTVYNELRMIEKNAIDHKHPFPIVMLHDTEWPYGRRDMYYDPNTIPKEFRHPYAMKGISPGLSHLVSSSYTINSHLNNALVEGGEKNGVLTAIEDFLKDSTLSLNFFKLYSNHGLGVLCQVGEEEKKIINKIMTQSKM